jgi:hypothetical protein
MNPLTNSNPRLQSRTTQTRDIIIVIIIIIIIMLKICTVFRIFLNLALDDDVGIHILAS